MTKREAAQRVITELRKVTGTVGPFESDRTLGELGLTQHQCDDFRFELFIGERLDCDPSQRPSASISLRTTLRAVIRTYQEWHSPVHGRGTHLDEEQPLYPWPPNETPKKS